MGVLVGEGDAVKVGVGVNVPSGVKVAVAVLVFVGDGIRVAVGSVVRVGTCVGEGEAVGSGKSWFATGSPNNADAALKENNTSARVNHCQPANTCARRVR